MSQPEAQTPPPRDTPQTIARAATLTSIGNLSSRVIGLLRETVKSFFFGNGQAASAYELASNLPSTVYDLLIGGMIGSALVPTFSALTADDAEAGRQKLGALLGALLGLAGAALLACSGWRPSRSRASGAAPRRIHASWPRCSGSRSRPSCL
jgi:peptidoglycan biosynthesis protein MviN/MurJ (putative lipid II flippase)